ncbi:MAG: hypothetical protein QOK29_2600 [Rhodospirillaceae bacterium]|nr:hypothetical protein [Rhodospirillaceae bacterium]
MTAAEAGGDDQIGPLAFFRIGHLARLDSGQFRRGHSGSGQNAGTLDAPGCAHHHDQIEAVLAPRLEEERDVENDQRPPGPPGSREKALLGPTHQRVEDRLQPLQRFWIAEDLGPERGAVDGTIAPDAREGGGHSLDGGAAGPEQAMHLPVGVMHGNSQPAQDFRGRRLAHPDRTGKPDYFHAAVRTKSRSSGVTSGVMPNQAAKPGRA